MNAARSNWIALAGLAMCCLAVVSCTSTRRDSHQGDTVRSTRDVKEAFARAGVPLTTAGIPEGGPNENKGLVIQLAPEGTTSDRWSVLVWVYATADDARRFEEFSLANPFVVGRAEPDRDVALRTGNVVAWVDAGSSKERRAEVDSALESLKS